MEGNRRRISAVRDGSRSIRAASPDCDDAGPAFRRPHCNHSVSSDMTTGTPSSALPVGRSTDDTTRTGRPAVGHCRPSGTDEPRDDGARCLQFHCGSSGPGERGPPTAGRVGQRRPQHASRRTHTSAAPRRRPHSSRLAGASRRARSPMAPGGCCHPLRRRPSALGAKNVRHRRSGLSQGQEPQGSGLGRRRRTV